MSGSKANSERTSAFTGAGTRVYGSTLLILPPTHFANLEAGVACSIRGLVAMTPASEESTERLTPFSPCVANPNSSPPP